MIDMHGTLALATASRSPSTRGERYRGSCTPDHEVEVLRIDRFRDRCRQLAGCPARIDLDERALLPLTGRRTRMPSIDQLRFSRKTRELHVVPCERSFAASSEPYEAPSQNIVSGACKTSSVLAANLGPRLHSVRRPAWGRSC